MRITPLRGLIISIITYLLSPISTRCVSLKRLGGFGGFRLGSVIRAMRVRCLRSLMVRSLLFRVDAGLPYGV